MARVVIDVVVVIVVVVVGGDGRLETLTHLINSYYEEGERESCEREREKNRA